MVVVFRKMLQIYLGEKNIFETVLTFKMYKNILDLFLFSKTYIT